MITTIPITSPVFDIYHHNLSYLFFLREHLKADKQNAAIQLNLDLATAECLLRLSPSALIELALNSQLLCHFALSYEMLTKIEQTPPHLQEARRAQETLSLLKQYINKKSK